ncbi:MAG: hypothetical protein ACPGOW_05605, partial [Paracoccaceae bacterium]
YKNKNSFVLYSFFFDWVFLFIKAARNKFYTKNTSESAFNAISDKIYLGVNLNIGEALWIQNGCDRLSRKCLALLIHASYDPAWARRI